MPAEDAPSRHYAMASAEAEKSRLQAHYDKQSAADYAGDSSAMIDYDYLYYGYTPAHTGAAGHAGPSAPSSVSRNSGSGAGAGAGAGALGVDPGAELPPYSGPASAAEEEALAQQRQEQETSAAPAAATQKKQAQRYPGLPALDYRLYQPPLFELSSDRTTIRSAAPYLSATASALAALIRAQATVPPKPMVQITGNRGRKVDFAVKLNLLALLVPEDARRWLNYVRCVGRGEMALRGGSKPAAVPAVESEVAQTEVLDAWCRRFCEDKTAAKTFVLERQVANLDLGWLEGQIRSLVAATGYKGAVTVAFPVGHARVVVQSPDRVNKFFTTVTSLFTGRSTYEVVKAVWPFATHKNGEPQRQCVVQSEETWWREWRDPIRYAISTQRSGWVTNEDKLEALMEGLGKDLARVDWGPDHHA